MRDPLETHADQVWGPATRAVAVVPHDSDALADIPKALYVGTGGTIVMRGRGDEVDRSWRNIPSGTVLPFRASHVRATGTSAADILALY